MGGGGCVVRYIGETIALKKTCGIASRGNQTAKMKRGRRVTHESAHLG